MNPTNVHAIPRAAKHPVLVLVFSAGWCAVQQSSQRGTSTVVDPDGKPVQVLQDEDTCDFLQPYREDADDKPAATDAAHSNGHSEDTGGRAQLGLASALRRNPPR